MEAGAGVPCSNCSALLKSLIVGLTWNSPERADYAQWVKIELTGILQKKTGIWD
jgi:hypothetical protein